MILVIPAVIAVLAVAAYVKRSGWWRTNQFLRQALEDAHAALTSCSADLELERFHVERLQHHLTLSANQLCPMCDELQRDLNDQLDHSHKLEDDNTRLEWECEKWRSYFAASVPPMDAS